MGLIWTWMMHNILRRWTLSYGVSVFPRLYIHVPDQVGNDFVHVSEQFHCHVNDTDGEYLYHIEATDHPNLFLSQKHKRMDHIGSSFAKWVQKISLAALNYTLLARTQLMAF